MTVFIIRRLLQSGLVVFAMTLIVFFGVNVVGDPIDLLEHLSTVRRLVVIDGCRSGARPGTIRRWDWSAPCLEGFPGQSTHRVSLTDVLQLADTLGRLPQFAVIYGVEVAQCQPQADMSAIVYAALPELTSKVTGELSANY